MEPWQFDFYNYNIGNISVEFGRNFNVNIADITSGQNEYFLYEKLKLARVINEYSS